MTKEESKLAEIVDRIIDVRRTKIGICPSWIATEGLNEIDPCCVAPVLVRLGCHLHLRQIARARLRGTFEDKSSEPMLPGIEGLQWRYPTERSKGSMDPEYILRESMSDDDIAFNVARLRAEGQAKLAHADALEAWGYARGAAA